MKYLLIFLLLINWSNPNHIYAQSDLWLSSIQATLADDNIHTQLNWELDNSAVYTITRKKMSEDSWTTLESNYVGDSFIDMNSNIGEAYEYKIFKTASAGNTFFMIYSGFEVMPAGHRGRLLLLVDDRFTLNLKDKIDRWIRDAEGDGWTVVQENVSMDADVKTIKSVIRNEYFGAKGLRAVFLLGHIPVPYSGLIAPDGHSNHNGAWAADVYYADMNEKWTDENVTTSGQPARTTNVPGDGKFDKSVFDKAEIEIGRVDFYNMPSLPLSEEELMIKYLDKNHAFKLKQFTPKYQAIGIDNFNRGFDANPDLNFPPMVGIDNYSTAPYRSSLLNDSYIWSYGAGPGTYTSAGGISNTSDMGVDSLQGIFTILFGSYFGDWDSANNYLRAALASGTILTNCWSTRPNWVFFQMALGTTIGRQTILSQNDNGIYNNGFLRLIHVALMGDPTLRMHMVDPIDDLSLEEIPEGIQLNWTNMDGLDKVKKYNIYKRNNHEDRFTFLASTADDVLTYVDNSALISDEISYMIRVEKLESSPSGSYYNESIGVQSTIEIKIADNDNDGFNLLSDCNDDDIDINPNAIEIPGNNIDEDCDGKIDEMDQDMDGFDDTVDCDDTNAMINPNALEIPNNGIDENCDGKDNYPDDCFDVYNQPSSIYSNLTSCPFLPSSLSSVGVLPNDAFILGPIYSDNSYTFDFCTDYDTNNWSALALVYRYDFVNNERLELISSTENCEVIINYSATNDPGAFGILVIIKDKYNCSYPNNMIENGYPIIDCITVDEDNDGFNYFEDCDDNNAMINPDAIEIPNNNIDEDCDGEALVIDEDNDGFNSDEDCDDNNAMINPDAIEIPNNNIDEDCDGEALVIDEDNDGFNSDEDCDDNNAMINPDAIEIPNNNIDEDCDGEALVIDEDNDGFNSDEDCDDNNAMINPDAIEIPNNNIDEDCDGEALVIDEDNDGFNSDEDCDDNNAMINPDAVEIPNNNIDEDCDGEALVIDEDNDGFNSDEDCDDNNAMINPDAVEIPNNFIDEDCDGEALVIDEDNDGFNSDEDCDDNNAMINPDAIEIPNNNIDEDCDGEALVIDEDNDGFNSDEDCDDNNAMINPDAIEIPNNNIDEDCDGEALVIDEDNDGFNSDEDCDDNNAMINPDAIELCDDLDNNCDGQTDEGLSFANYYIDQDMDGYGTDDSVINYCLQPPGTSTVGGDCDDTNPNVNPAAIELADNGLDDDCDGNEWILTGVNELENAITLFPNPANDIINISVDFGIHTKARVFSLTGETIKYKAISKGTCDITELNPGVYFIEIKSIKGKRFVLKFIKL